MNRARCTFAATLVGVSFVSALLIAQTPTAPPMTSVLAGKKLTPPIRGQADVDFTAPVTKREKDMVITRIQVRNMSAAPIPRLTITETWYDAGGASVGGGKGAINGLLQPGEIQTIVIETPYNPKMSSNAWNFSHANGTVKTSKVKTLDDKSAASTTAGAKEPAAKPATTAKK